MLYGGARGGGKTDFLIADFLQDVEKYGPLWQGIIFRRSYDPELKETMKRAGAIYPKTGARLVDKDWIWPNGACLRMRYLDNPSDYMNYVGHAYTWMGWDELGLHKTDEGYKAMIGSLRSALGPVPTIRIRATANPGGPGHEWVKDRFGIAQHPGGSHVMYDPDTGMTRLFVKSRVQDNKILMSQDPLYVARLRGTGSKARVQAWLDGDWGVIDSGGILLRGWWRHWGAGAAPDWLTLEQAMAWRAGAPPKFDHVILSIDTAHTEKSSADYSAITVWGVWTDARYYAHMMCISAWQDKVGFPALRTKALQLIHGYEDEGGLWRSGYEPDTVLIESKTAGVPLIQELRLEGIMATAYNPGKDKVARAHAAAPALECGALWLPRSTDRRRWPTVLIDHCDAFPKGPHDDIADTVTMTVEHARRRGLLRVHANEQWTAAEIEAFEQAQDQMARKGSARGSGRSTSSDRKGPAYA